MDKMNQPTNTADVVQSKIQALELKVNFLVAEVEMLRRYILTGNSMNANVDVFLPVFNTMEQRPANSITENKNETTEAPKSTVALAEFIKQPLESSSQNINDIIKTLKPMHFVNVSQSTLSKIVRELILLHNKPGASGTELKQISGLSAAGMAKQIARLKKVGLITKADTRMYKLTNKAHELMFKSLNK